MSISLILSFLSLHVFDFCFSNDILFADSRNSAMKKNKMFSILKNETYLPDDFRCLAVDFRGEKCFSLRQLGCSAIIEVDSPAGWRIARLGNSERFHLDIFFISTGKLTVATQAETFTCTAGQRLLIPSWITREVTVTEHSSHIYVRFDQPELFPSVKEISVAQCTANEAITFFTRQLLVSHSPFPDDTDYRANLLDCMATLFSRELHPRKQSQSPEQYERLIAFLQNVSGKDATVYNVAKELGMSISALRLFCLKNFAKPPLALINDFKMSKAKALLNYSSLPIDAVAERLGYSDRFSFSKAFSRCNKISPGEYRKSSNLNSD